MMFMMQQLQPLMAVNNEDSHYEWMSYWAFSDIFEEDGFFSSEFWMNDGVKNKHFGMRTIRGIDKPVFNAMRLVYAHGSNVSYSAEVSGSGNNSHNVMVFCLQNGAHKNRYSVFIANFAN